MRGNEVKRGLLPDRQSSGILSHGSALIVNLEVTILLILGMITVVPGVIGVSSRDLRQRIAGEIEDGFAIGVVTMDIRVRITILTE